MKPIISFVRRHPLLAMVALLLCLTPSTVGATSPANAAPDFTAIDAYVQAQMDESRIPGLALAIVHGDQIVYLKGYGRAEPSGRPVTPQTPFMLASLAKPMTALAVMQLVEAGKLDLDAPVQRYLPWFRVADENASAQITVRELLYHTSGLSELTGLEYAGVEDLGADALERHVRALRDVQLVHPVGTTYAYNNLNYQTLGLIIQEVTGQPYEAYMQEHVFKPLGMNQTFTSKSDAQRNGLATGYRYWFRQPVAFDSPFDRGGVPSGFIIASVEDVAHFVIPHLNAGRSGDTQILSPRAMDQILTPAGRKGSSDESYAMDWGIQNFDGQPWVLKGGDLADFKAQMVLVPGGQWGVVTLINTNNSLGSFLGDLRIPFIPIGVTKILLGNPSPLGPASNVPSILLGILVLILVLQLIWIVWSWFVLRRWRAEPARRPRSRWSIFWRVFFLPILNIAVALLAVVGLPQMFRVPVSFLTYMMPDLGYTLVAIGVLGIGGSIVWFALAYRVLHAVKLGAPASVT
jgi:CubicO group peptidase (beta-lactamase class C family)